MPRNSKIKLNLNRMSTNNNFNLRNSLKLSNLNNNVFNDYNKSMINL
jgi:hypothetical protein